MPRVSQVHSLLANLKHKNGNKRVEREKWDHSSGQLSRDPGLCKRRTKVRVAWLLI